MRSARSHVLIVLLVSIVLVSCGGEREGTIDTSDCRETVNLNSGNLQQYFKHFTCQYTRRASGKIAFGICTRVETYGTWLHYSDKCKTAYVYAYSNTDSGCTEKYPYAGNDDKCHANWEKADRATKPGAPGSTNDPLGIR